MPYQWLILLVGLVIVGCQHDESAAVPQADNVSTTNMPPYEYYTGSDFQNDYFTILHSGPQNKTFNFKRALDPDRTNRFAHTKDQSRWQLVPGSSAP